MDLKRTALYVLYAVHVLALPFGQAMEMDTYIRLETTPTYIYTIDPIFGSTVVAVRWSQESDRPNILR